MLLTNPNGRPSTACALILLAVTLPGANCLAGALVYVDVNATGPTHNGTSWCSAYLSLSDGLAAATAGTTIRVANGNYTPDPTGLPDPRTATFAMAVGVTVEGGYAGCGAPNPDARDVALFETILTGDLAGDDGTLFTNYAENAYHVVTAQFVDETAVLDGVIIQHGHADGTAAPATCFGGPNNLMTCTTDANCAGAPCVSLDSIGAGMINLTAGPTLQACVIRDNLAAFQGAGMQIKNGNPVILGCTFSGNRALDNGGAMYNGFSSPIVTDCQFLNNSGQNYAGAICNRDGSNGTFTNCTFTGNTAAELTTTGGGAVLNAASSPDFIGCTFDANISMQGFGGGMYNKMGFIPALGGSHPTLTNCTFSNNEAIKGGGMYSKDASSAMLTDCMFADNKAIALEVSHGGGMYSQDGSNPTLIGCTFLGNAALGLFGDGGAVYNKANEPSFVDCTFSNNFSQYRGGAMYSSTGSAPVLTGCVISSNTSDGDADLVAGSAGGLYFFFSTPTMTDCSITDNVASRYGGGVVLGTTTGVPRFTRCVFERNFSPARGGGLRITGSPVLIDCVFRDNTTSIYGGGISMEAASNPTLINCLFQGNWADERGGAVYSLSGPTPTFVNCAFAANGCAEPGGAFYGSTALVTMINCSFTANTAFHGSALGFDSFQSANPGQAILRNCILFDGGDEIYNNDNTDVQITYSNVQGGWAGVGNIAADPLFVDADGLDDIPGTADDDLRLLAASPCVNAGENAALPADEFDLDQDGDTAEATPIDLSGAARQVSQIVDIGAMEQDDCNDNGIADAVDLAAGTSSDCDANALPDECQPDDDLDGVPNTCDVCPGLDDTLDADADTVPDGCDVCGGFDDTLDADGDAVPDGCDVCSGFDDALDCNTNQTPDGCDIGAGFSLDENLNGLPDECEPPSVDVAGCRYLTITPLPGTVPVAMLVNGDPADPAIACLSQFVQADGFLGNDPVFRLPEDWGIVRLHGQAIRPQSSYSVYRLDGTAQSQPREATTLVWGDVNADGVASFADIQFIVFAFQGEFGDSGLESMDLDPCIPDGVINFSDIQKGVLAFQGSSFSDTTCTPPCP